MPVSQHEEGIGPSVRGRPNEPLMEIGTQAGRPVYAFDNYRLDTQNCRLWHGNAPIALPPKAFDILHVLIQHAGQLIEKKALLRAVWPNTFVEEGNLSVYISTLRKVFSKKSPNIEFIETVPRRGYRFTVPITQWTTASDVQPPQAMQRDDALIEENVISTRKLGVASIATRNRRIVPKQFLWILLVSIFAAVIITVPIVVRRDTHYLTKPAQVAADSHPLTSVPGVFSWPTFSPDGNRLAYAWRASTDSFRNIYIQSVNSDERDGLTNGGGDSFSPAWSPRGEEIAFLHSSKDLKSLEVDVAEVQMPHIQRRLTVINDIGSAFHDLPSLAWAPDGKWLLTTEKNDTDGSSSLVLISIENGRKQVLTRPPTLTIDDNGVFSPDGSFVAFLRARGPSSGEIYIIPVHGDSERRLPFHIHSIDGLTWSPDGQSLIVSSARAISVGSLWKIYLNGDPPIALSSLPAHTSDPVISLTAHRLAYVDILRNVSLWRMPADGRGKDEQLIASDFIDSAPDYSPDDSQIAFESDRSGATEIWTCRSDGKQCRRVTNIFGPMTGSPRWSPDGRMLAFDSRLKGRSAIFIVSASAGDPIRITTGAFDAADNVVPSWSHDGQSLYFSSNRTGRCEVWRKRVSGDEETQITKQGGFNGIESADGKSLYYVQDTDKTTIWRVPLSGGKSQQVSEVLGAGMWGYWTIAGNNLFYLQRTGGGSSPAAIFRLDLRAGTKVRLGQTQFGVNESDKGLAVSPDGRWLLYAQRDVDRSSIMLVNDWY
jgi:Tol biopolymer transport system component/DNA-binding winged helix-turn-helix (wHTH) protein